MATRGIAPIYRADGDGLRLVTVMRAESASADLGECARVVDEHGDPVRVLVLRSAPLAPGTRVTVEPDALLHLGPGESPILVGRPRVDIHAPTVDDGLRAGLARLAFGGGQAFAQSAMRWDGVDAAVAYVQEGIARASRLRGGRIATAGWRPRELEGHPGADAQVRRLPARFQSFVGELLVPDERIHFFAGRLERLPRTVFGHATGEAMLLATDRQLLWIEDARPRDAYLMSWGYEARSLPLERIASVESTDGGLCVLSEAGGPPFVVAGLPAIAKPLLDQIAGFALGFVRRDGLLPMRRYDVPVRADPLVPDGWPDARPIAEGLLALLEREYGVTPRISAYLKPAHPGKDREGLLALYPHELLFVSASGRGRTSVPLHEIAWVELRRSVLSSHLRLAGVHEERWPVASAAPLVPFLRSLRQLIANPASCAR